MKITEFDIEVCRDNVFALIDCYEDSAIYEEVIDEYEEMLPKAYEKIDPVGLLEFGDVECFDLEEYGENITQAIYCITSVGRKLSEWSSQMFAEGNYLGGMLADAIADDYLFQMDHRLQEPLVAMCKEKKYGVLRRLEAPQDIPMMAQKKALEVTRGGELAKIRVLESYMYDPVKTTCQIYLLEENSSMFRIHHDCSKCPNINCKVRNVSEYAVTVHTGNTFQVLKGKKGKSLHQILQEQGVYLSAVCGGRGTCGKCMIQVQEGTINPSKEDVRFFTPEQLQDGYRLACKAYPESDCVISIAQQEQRFVVLADVQQTDKNSAKKTEITGAGYGVSVDIGTTTIAMQLINLDTEEAENVFTTINRQRAYGADVISRIEASNGGKKEALRNSILQDIQEGMDSLVGKSDVPIEKMIIGANTTMVHLLMGYSCETLGIAPFTPVNIDSINTTYKELFGGHKYSFEITVLPGISTFVGGDVVAGLYTLGFHEKERVSVLIDLGTNGEMAIGNKEKILVASTAAGPAFEGGNITFGTGSIPGAICEVQLEGGKVEVQTILHETPTGICGTGVIDSVYELMKAELVDETGLLDEEYFEDGFPLAKNEAEEDISFFQKDVREIQLAKSAVRAGLETLILHFGVTYEEIDQIYIAGGFGYKIDISKAVGIGLLPKEGEKKIKAIGNSCLKGAREYLLHPEGKKTVADIIRISSEVQLSKDKHFNEFYMDYMYFE